MAAYPSRLAASIMILSAGLAAGISPIEPATASCADEADSVNFAGMVCFYCKPRDDAFVCDPDADVVGPTQDGCQAAGDWDAQCRYTCRNDEYLTIDVQGDDEVNGWSDCNGLTVDCGPYQGSCSDSACCVSGIPVSEEADCKAWSDGFWPSFISVICEARSVSAAPSINLMHNPNADLPILFDRMTRGEINSFGLVQFVPGEAGISVSCGSNGCVRSVPMCTASIDLERLVCSVSR